MTELYYVIGVVLLLYSVALTTYQALIDKTRSLEIVVMGSYLKFDSAFRKLVGMEKGRFTGGLDHTMAKNLNTEISKAHYTVNYENQSPSITASYRKGPLAGLKFHLKTIETAHAIRVACSVAPVTPEQQKTSSSHLS